MTALRWKLAQWILGAPLTHPWDLAQFDRIYVDRRGRRLILDGSAGHSTGLGFHHGPREGCPVCADGAGRTNDLPRRFRHG